MERRIEAGSGDKRGKRDVKGEGKGRMEGNNFAQVMAVHAPQDGPAQTPRT